MEVSHLHHEDNEDNSGDPGESPLRWEKERDDHEENGGVEVFLKQVRGSDDGEAHHQLLPEGKR